VVLVAQSLGGFTAPLVCEQVKVSALVFVNAMIPVPGERVGDWGEATGSSEARTTAARRGGYSPRFDEHTYFFHDVPRALVDEGARRDRAQSERIFEDICRFERWPRVPIRVIAGRDDRLFPLPFQRRVAKARLGVKVEALKGGHLVALSNPKGLAQRLLSA
jgi:pimeloyl-ACP methyl ester carboxylesterase